MYIFVQISCDSRTTDCRPSTRKLYIEGCFRYDKPLCDTQIAVGTMFSEFVRINLTISINLKIKQLLRQSLLNKQSKLPLEVCVCVLWIFCCSSVPMSTSKGCVCAMKNSHFDMTFLIVRYRHCFLAEDQQTCRSTNAFNEFYKYRFLWIFDIPHRAISTYFSTHPLRIRPDIFVSRKQRRLRHISCLR